MLNLHKELIWRGEAHLLRELMDPRVGDLCYINYYYLIILCVFINYLDMIEISNVGLGAPGQHVLVVWLKVLNQLLQCFQRRHILRRLLIRSRTTAVDFSIGQLDLVGFVIFLNIWPILNLLVQWTTF